MDLKITPRTDGAALTDYIKQEGRLPPAFFSALQLC